MIESFKDTWLHEFYVQAKNHKKIPAQLSERLFRKLQLIDDATSDNDLRSPPSNHFEKLKGNLAKYCSIRINDKWRLIFIWDAKLGKASEIYLDDHSYR